MTGEIFADFEDNEVSPCNIKLLSIAQGIKPRHISSPLLKYHGNFGKSLSSPLCETKAERLAHFLARSTAKWYVSMLCR